MHHCLIGIPSSGKSTFAARLAALNDRTVIICPDRIRGELYGDETIQGNWQEIEAVIIDRIQTAIAAEQTIVYDATNTQRAWRLNFIEKAANAVGKPLSWMGWYLTTPIRVCKAWNRQRQRQVPEEVLDVMVEFLKTFPPDTAEGFIKLVEVDASKKSVSDRAIQQEIDRIRYSISSRKSRTSNYILHCYSRLLDFERLIHLISLILAYPGLGNLQQTHPDRLESILGKTTQFETDIAEISAVMAHLKGEVYANPTAISADLDWLKLNGLIGTSNPDRLSVELQIEQIDRKTFLANGYPCHRYSDLALFQPLVQLIRYLVHNPFAADSDRTESKNRQIQQKLLDCLHQEKIIQYYTKSQFRRDIEEILKPYQILNRLTMTKGYFIGTAIFDRDDLKTLYQLLQSQKTYLEDPIAIELSDRFQHNIAAINLFDLEECYPTRVIGNRSIVNSELLPTLALPRQLKKLETAIEQGELLKLSLTPHSARFTGEESTKTFTAYPLQIIFHNVAWYLGYETVDGDESGLFYFQRLDRLQFEQTPSHTRGIEQQCQALKKLKKLYEESFGIYLGSSADTQRLFLKGMSIAQLKLELWMNDRSFKFICEGTQRFPKMKMSAPPERAEVDRKLFCLPQTKDPQFPHQLKSTLPAWSIDDIELIRWILGFQGNIKVCKPDNLAEKIASSAEAIGQNYR